MKKIYSLLFVLSILMTTSLGAQNLLNGWDGNGVTGDLSKPNDAGWLNTTTSVPWNTANAGGGCRFRDAGVGFTAGTFTNETDASVNDARHLMLRYDNSAYSASIYAYPATLEANTTYEFTMDFLCGGSATPPKNMTIGASSTPNMTGKMTEQIITSTASANIYRKASMTFTTSTAGVYYITFKGDFAWFGVTNLHLAKSAVQLTELTSQFNGLDLGDLSGVTSNLTLPTVLGTQGVTATWQSSNEAIISNTGVVTRPEKYNKVVRLTATVSQLVQDSVYSLTKTFNAVVLGMVPTPLEVAQWDFNSSSISFKDGVTQVADNKSSFVGTIKNEAKIRTIGNTNQYNVLDLGNGTGHFDMGKEIGEAIYSLTDYTLCGYFRIDENYPSLASNGNFYWTFSNSADIDADKNGYIIGSLKSQGVSVANYYNVNNTAINVNPADPNVFRGSWHHFAFVQNGNTGTIYIDGEQKAQNVNMTNLPAFLLPRDGKTGTDYNWLGRSNYKNDVYLRQTLLYDFRVYSVPLSDADINWEIVNVAETLGLLNSAYAENPNYVANELLIESDNLSLGDLTAIISNINLPKQGALDPAIQISWNSTSGLIGTDGTVTRPDFYNFSDTLTATLFKNGQFVTKKFPYTVLAKDGSAFTSDLLVKYDFSQYDNDSTVTDVAEKKFKGVLKNDASISTIGTTNQYQVLNLGDSIGYFDMGAEMGQVFYHLEDYTISAYYRVDTAYHDISRAGNFLWNISNSKDLMGNQTGAIIFKLNDQGYSITPKNYTSHQTLIYGSQAIPGGWHHIAYTQSGNDGTLYVDGMPVQTDTITYLPKNTLRTKGQIGTLYNWLGRSSYMSDVYLRKTLVYDFRVYKKALTEAEIQVTELNVGNTIAALDVAFNEGVTALPDVRESSYQIYAVNGEIRIKGLEGNERISIYDISGRQVNSQLAKASSYKVGSGIYIVRIDNFAKKVMVR